VPGAEEQEPPGAAAGGRFAWRRLYPHIRVAALAYHGNPKGPFEDELARNSISFAVISPTYLQHYKNAAPQMTRLIYSNCSNLYLELLLDWMAFADARGVSREVAFYHVAAARSYRGDSPSSFPVPYFWRSTAGAPGS
jgi:hypothetical protein